ncbi:MAG: hypothetical protein V4519_02240 [Patescibacteria group bacterium]
MFQLPLSHAYIVEGNAEEIRPSLFEFLENTLKFPIAGNPDFWHEIHESLTIDAARALRETQSKKAIGGDRKIFIIEARGMSIEAQNALLKAFEEPTPGTHFFLILPSIEVVLPTLRSRVQIISGQNSYENAKQLAQEYKKLSVGDRMKKAAAIAEEKDKALAMQIVDGLMYVMRDSQKPFVMQELLQCRSYLNDRSPSIKMILEHIALII